MAPVAERAVVSPEVRRGRAALRLATAGAVAVPIVLWLIVLVGELVPSPTRAATLVIVGLTVTSGLLVVAGRQLGWARSAVAVLVGLLLAYPAIAFNPPLWVFGEVVFDSGEGEGASLCVIALALGATAIAAAGGFVALLLAGRLAGRRATRRGTARG